MKRKIDRKNEFSNDQGGTEKAVEEYSRETEPGEDPVKKNDTPKARRDSVLLYRELAFVYEREKKKDQTETYYLKALEFTEGLVEDFDEPRDRLRLVELYERLFLFYLYVPTGEGDRAEELYERADEFFERMAKKSDSFEYRRKLRELLFKISHCNFVKGKTHISDRLYQRALEIGESLVEEGGIFEDRWELSDLYYYKVSYFEKKGETDKAEELYKKIAEIREGLVKESKGFTIRYELSCIYNDMGDFYKRKSDLEKAKEYYIKTADIKEVLAEKETEYCADYWRALYDLSPLYSNLAEVYDGLGESDMGDALRKMAEGSKF